MTKPKMKRVSLSLPENLVNQLDRVSGVQGISRSAMISALLAESFTILDSMLKAEVDPSQEGLRRFRGDSVEFVNEKVAEIKELLQSMEVRKDA